MQVTSTDVIVVGDGIVGAAIAWRIAVTATDRGLAHSRGTSSRYRHWSTVPDLAVRTTAGTLESDALLSAYDLWARYSAPERSHGCYRVPGRCNRGTQALMKALRAVCLARGT